MDSEAKPLVAHVVNTLEGGGMERTVRTILDRADRSRFRHALITLRHSGEFCQGLPRDVSVYALGTRGACRLSFLRLAGVLRRWRPSVVHARGAGCWSDTVFASTMAGRLPMILGFHGAETGDEFTANQRRAARWGQRFGATFASVSRAGRELLEDRFNLSRKDVVHLPNGVDSSRFTPPGGTERERARAALQIPLAASILGTVASLTPVKRHDLMIDALELAQRSHVDLRLLVVGSGPLRAKLAGRARRRGVEGRVIFAGQREDVSNVYHAMDGYVCASDSEGVSNSVLEAMACGLPVITTNVGDHGILIRDGVEGVVVPTRCADSLGHGINRLLLSPAARDAMGVAAGLRVSAMRLTDMVARYEQLYERIVSARGRQARSGEGAPAIAFAT